MSSPMDLWFKLRTLKFIETRKAVMLITQFTSQSIDPWFKADACKPETSTAMETVWVWGCYHYGFNNSPIVTGRVRWCEALNEWRADGSNSEVTVLYWQYLPEKPSYVAEVYHEE